MGDAIEEFAVSGHDASAGRDFAPVHFSSADVSPRDRIAIFREMLGQQILHLDIEPLRDWPLQGEATLRRLPGARLAIWDMSGLRLARTRALLADNDDAFSLVMNLGRNLSASAQGRRVRLARGGAVPLHTMEPSTSICSSRLQLASVTVPRTALAPFIAHVEDAVMQVIPPSSEALRLLQSYLQAMIRVELPLATPEVRHLAVTHLHDLMALAIGATGDGAALAKARGLSAARLQAVKADIIANLPRQDLSLGFISRRQRLSPRHIRRLFGAEGTTFTDFLLEQRLVRAHRMLADPHNRNWPVSTIAYECGFGDLSHFNHTFRRRFGVTPTQHREGNRDESDC